LKKKLLIAISLALLLTLSFSSAVFAQDPPEEGVVTVNMEGSDFAFEVWTQVADAQDVFAGEAYGTLEMAQIIRFQPSGQWSSDAPDIDRGGLFVGDGSLRTESWYNSSAQWSWGESYTGYYVESDTKGSLGQNLHFDSNWGGVRDVDPWKKQRNAELYAEGNYYLSLSSIDQRGSPDYGFNFEATDSGSQGRLFLGTMQTTTEHGSGQWFTPDELIVDFLYTYNGSPGVNVSWLAETGGTISMTIDLIQQYISGVGMIW